MGVSFRKIASRRLMIEHLEMVGATSGWVMRLNRDQEDNVLLLGLLDTFVHRMYEIVRKREKDISVELKWVIPDKMAVCSYQIITNGFPYNLKFIHNGLICKCKLQMLTCKCLLADASLQMLACKCKLQTLAANACLQMQAANAGCKCLLANACCKCKLQMQAANASCKCKLHMQAANACLQMQDANANAKARCKWKLQILDENAGYKCFTEY
ncbi:hypothetical protein Tco_0793361 [Tanacetum coccineum]